MYIMCRKKPYELVEMILKDIVNYDYNYIPQKYGNYNYYHLFFGIITTLLRSLGKLAVVLFPVLKIVCSYSSYSFNIGHQNKVKVYNFLL